MFSKKQTSNSPVRQRLTVNHNQTLVQAPVRPRLTLNHNQTLVRSR
jgi:hypothetical protein